VRAMRSIGGRVVSLDVSGHWNRVVIAGRDTPAPWTLRRCLAAHPAFSRIYGRLAMRSH